MTDITAAIETPWLHKLWLGLVLTTGRSSITTFVLTWAGDCVCGHLLSSNLTLDLRWNCHVVVTTMLYLLHIWLVSSYVLNLEPGVYVCTHAHRRSQTSVWLFIVATQAPSFAFTMFTTNYTVPWTITIENVISEMCYAIQLRLIGQVK